MVSEIRIYVEGGGNRKDAKSRLREGFNEFLKDIALTARNKQIKWQIVACGSRNQAFDSFITALETHANAFNILLVDSEGPVQSRPWQYLQGREPAWHIPPVDDEHCHLMVQMMEAWLIADIEGLRRYYGQGFQANAIPHNPNVEEIDKDRVEAALKAASRFTSKGEYCKRHGWELLKCIDSSQVRQAAPHCERLFTTLLGKINTHAHQPPAL